MNHFLWQKRNLVALFPLVGIYAPVVGFYMLGNHIQEMLNQASVASIRVPWTTVNPMYIGWYVVWISACFVSFWIWVVTWILTHRLISRTLEVRPWKNAGIGILLLLFVAWSYLSLDICKPVFEWCGWKRMSYAGILIQNFEDSLQVKNATPVYTTLKLLNYGFSAGLHAAYLCCAVLVAKRPKANVSIETEAFELSERMRYLRIALILGAAVMTAGVLRVFALYELLLAKLDSEELRIVSGGVLLFISAYYTVMIACMYLPAAVILHGRADRIARRASAEQRKEWLEGSGMLALRAELIPGLLGIMAPVMTGVLGLTLERMLRM